MALYSGTEKDVVQTPWSPRRNGVGVRQFSARHLVYCNVGRHKETARELTKSCMFRPVPVHFDSILDRMADVNGPDIGIFLPAKITSIFRNRVR